MSEARNWLVVCDADAIEEEDVVRFDHGGATYAVYRTPLHQGRFHIPTGKAKSPPVCIDLKTYPVRVQDGKVLIGLPG